MARRGKNEGTIFKKPNGSYRAQVSIDGQRLSYTGKSRADCNDWLLRKLSEINQGMTFEGRKKTLDQYLEEWITSKKGSVKQNTIIQYQKFIRLYIFSTLGKMKLVDLNLNLINRFYIGLVDKDIGLSSIRYLHRVLHAAFEDAVKSGVIGKNPVHGAKLPKVKRKEMQILNEQQVGHFLLAASQSRNRALYHLAITTGMRKAELRGLSWSDVDWFKGTITVNKQIQNMPGVGSVTSTPKTDSGYRIIRVGEKTLSELRSQRERIDLYKRNSGDNWKENDLVFPSRIGTPFVITNLRLDFLRVLETANLPSIRFHDLRHTAASLMLGNGIPPLVVSKILGHSSPSVTLNIYAHSTLDMQEAAASVMDAIVTPIPVNVAQLHPIAPAEKE